MTIAEQSRDELKFVINLVRKFKGDKAADHMLDGSFDAVVDIMIQRMGREGAYKLLNERADAIGLELAAARIPNVGSRP